MPNLIETTGSVEQCQRTKEHLNGYSNPSVDVDYVTIHFAEKDTTTQDSPSYLINGTIKLRGNWPLGTKFRIVVEAKE